jgi:hypothetical protein
MIKPLDVSNPHADHEESIERITKILGRGELRLDIFNFIYGRGSIPRSVTEIVEGVHRKASQRQLVLNEINHLAKHKTVSKDRRAFKGGGRKEFVYGKIDFVMANKQEILRNLRKPSLLAKMPTKRRPQITAKILIPAKTRRAGDKGVGNKLKVLYLTAAPASQASLRTEAEFRSVQRELRGSTYRNRVEIFISPAADAKSILDGINDHRPQIVHFSGHGGGEAIWLDDGKVENSVGRPMKFDLLAQAVSATSTPPTMLVLNACDTLIGARVLLDAVKVVVGMSDAISDIGAATFAAQFYAAIASGQPITAALTQGRVAMKAAMLSDSHLPEIIHRKDSDPNKIVLVK